MSIRTVFLLVLAVGFAAATAMYARTWAIAQRSTVQSAPLITESEPDPQPLVLVASRDTPVGAFMGEDLLIWQPWPEDGINDSYIVRKPGADADKEETTPFTGAVVRHALTKGQPITEALLVHPGERGFLAAVLMPGNRAISVPINNTTGISGFVFPGDRVDLLLTLRLQGEDEEGQGQTRHAGLTLLDEVRVLAIDQAVVNEDGGAMLAKTATLEVSPTQAEKVALALRMGTLSLSLRSLRTPEETLTETTGAPQLTNVAALSSPKQKPLKTARARNFTLDVEVFSVNGRDTTLSNRRRAKTKGDASRIVTVLRGSKSEDATY